MRSCSLRVIFSTVVNKGGQFGSPVGNRKWLDDARQTKGRKGCNLLISQFEAFVEICIADFNPVGPCSTAMTRPLCSTGISPLHRYYGAVRPLSGASVLSASRLEPLAPFPLASPARFLIVPVHSNGGRT